MMKPFTCVCLLAAAGSLLYLYQEKHSAQLVDRQISGLIRQADQIRERTRLMQAEYQMLNDPERLAQLATQHLALQQLAPTQYAKLSDLGARLPGPVAPAPAPAAMDDDPVTAPAPPVPAVQATAGPALARPAVAAAAPPASARAVAVPPAAVAAPVVKTQVAAVTPPVHRVTKPHDEPASMVKVASQPLRPSYAHDAGVVYAPILPAFASQAPPPAPRAPTMQRASAGLPDAPAPYVGSALGMARTGLAAPVPMSDAGASYGR